MAPPAGVVELRRTTRLRGAGLLLPLRSAGGDVGREADEGGAPPEAWTLPARTCLLVWRTPGRSSVSAPAPAVDDVDRLRALRRRGAMLAPVEEEAALAAAIADADAPPSGADAPSLNRAFVRALSFMGIGISSSELSACSVVYCCWESCAAAWLAAAADEFRFEAVPEEEEAEAAAAPLI